MKTFKSFIQLDEVERVKYNTASANKLAAVSYLAQTKDPGDLEHVGPEEMGPKDVKLAQGKRKADRLDNKQPFGEELHPQAHQVLKHIKPEHHNKYKPHLQNGTYKHDFADRSAVLKAAQRAGHLKEESIGEGDAYDKDRYAVKNGKAVKDNPTHYGSPNYKDQPHHVWATSAENALKKRTKKKEVEDKMSEAESHQSKTTMKHISNPNAAEKKAAKDIKPGIKGVRDRLDMLRAAKARGALKEDDLAELSTKTLAKAAKSASDPDSDYSYGKSHDPQKFADHAKKTKDAKSAAAVQGAADAKSHYPRPGHTVGGNDTLANRTKSRITTTGKANKQDVKTLKGKIQSRNEDIDVEMLLNLYDQLDESNQEIFLNQLEEDAEVLLAFAKTIAEE
jgi:hypothetical protein